MYIVIEQQLNKTCTLPVTFIIHLSSFISLRNKKKKHQSLYLGTTSLRGTSGETDQLKYQSSFLSMKKMCIWINVAVLPNWIDVGVTLQNVQ